MLQEDSEVALRGPRSEIVRSMGRGMLLTPLPSGPTFNGSPACSGGAGAPIAETSLKRSAMEGDAFALYCEPDTATRDRD